MTRKTGDRKKMRMLAGLRNVQEVAVELGTYGLKLSRAIEKGYVMPPTHVVNTRKYFHVDELEQVKRQWNSIEQRSYVRREKHEE